MYKLHRPEAPESLALNWEIWGQEWQQRKTQNSKAQFNWRTYRGDGRGDWFQQLSEMTKGHCAFCDVDFAGSCETIEHFLPKSHFPLLAFKWQNLYPCCSRCQSEKGEKFNRKLLRPDMRTYRFSDYFVCDFKTGEIKPNPRASSHKQSRADISIRLYNLNRAVLKKQRLRELKSYECQAKDPDCYLDDFNFRYFLV